MYLSICMHIHIRVYIYMKLYVYVCIYESRVAASQMLGLQAISTTLGLSHQTTASSVRTDSCDVHCSSLRTKAYTILM